MEIEFTDQTSVAPGTNGKHTFLIHVLGKFVDGQLVALSACHDLHFYQDETGGVEHCSRRIEYREKYPNWPKSEPE